VEMAKKEVVAVEEAGSARVEAACRELDDMELTLVGGGQGDITLGRTCS